MHLSYCAPRMGRTGIYVNLRNVYHTEIQISSAPELLHMDRTIPFGEGAFCPVEWDSGRTECNAELSLRARPCVTIPFVSQDLERKRIYGHPLNNLVPKCAGIQ